MSFIGWQFIENISIIIVVIIVLYLLILFSRIIPILNLISKSIEDILRYRKISFDTLNTLVTGNIGFQQKKCVTRLDLS